MIILNKDITEITEIVKSVPKVESCIFIIDELESMTKAAGVDHDKDLFNYKDLVNHALGCCQKEIPSPFSSLYPNCYGLNLGNDYFTLKIPNKFGFGVRVIPTKKGIIYELSLVFFNNKLFVEQSDYYKELINDGWKVKER